MVDPSFNREDQNNSVSLNEAKIFVGGLPKSLTEEELQSEFSKFGRVVDALIILDRETNQSKGYGFVIFSSKLEARKVSALNSICIKGKKVTFFRVILG
jgi:RNA recognition motif-containing protein